MRMANLFSKSFNSNGQSLKTRSERWNCVRLPGDGIIELASPTSTVLTRQREKGLDHCSIPLMVSVCQIYNVTPAEVKQEKLRHHINSLSDRSVKPQALGLQTEHSV